MYETKLAFDDWKITIDDKKAGLVIWQRTTDEGLKAMKAQAILDYNSLDLFHTLTNVNYRNDFDKVYESGSTIAKIADQTSIVYQKSKKISIV